MPIDHRRPESDERVVHLHRRQTASPRPGLAVPPSSESDSVSDLSRFEQSEEPDDYRHRMTTNLIALVFTVLLVGAGIWIADIMAGMRKNQDCVLSGRRGCTPVEIPSADR